MERFFEGQKVVGTTADKDTFKGLIEYREGKAFVVNSYGEEIEAEDLFQLKITGRNLREDAQDKIDSFIDQFDPEKVKDINDSDKQVLVDTAMDEIGEDAKGNEDQIEDMVTSKLASVDLANSSDSQSNTLAKYLKEKVIPKPKAKLEEKAVGDIVYNPKTDRYLLTEGDSTESLKIHFIESYLKENINDYLFMNESQEYLETPDVLKALRLKEKITLVALSKTRIKEDFEDEIYGGSDEESYNMYDRTFPTEEEVIERLYDKMDQNLDPAALVGFVQIQLECDEDEAEEIVEKARQQKEGTAVDAVSVEEEIDQVLEEYTEANGSSHIEDYFEACVEHFKVPHLKESLLEECEGNYEEAFVRLEEKLKRGRLKEVAVSPSQFREALKKHLEEEQLESFFVSTPEERTEIVGSTVSDVFQGQPVALVTEDEILIEDEAGLEGWVDELLSVVEEGLDEGVITEAEIESG
ncbi:hypothetical protein FACS189444_1420 [Spirochaetia bacterium]|nr:hypothetical protein FACS189444_1420 [Spirochaetia bacterium]